MKKLLVLFCLIFLLQPDARASHAAAAGELLYEWVHDSTYIVYLKLYRDCYDTSAPDTQSLCVKNRCNSYTASYPMNALPDNLPTSVANGSEINHHCASVSTNCVDINSMVPGFTEYWYEAYVTLPSRCNYWEFSVSVGGRSWSITNLATLDNMWLDATLDNEHFQGNSSPSFSVKPVPYVCDNMDYVYSNGVTDIDRDSLIFELEYPSYSSLCTDTLGDNPDYFEPVVIPKNLFNNPLDCNNTFSLINKTGDFYFKPSGSQSAIVNLLIKSYRNGILVGHVMRDIDIVVRECNNDQPIIAMNVANPAYRINTFGNGYVFPSPFVLNQHSGPPDTLAPFLHGYIDKCSGDSLDFSMTAQGGDTYAILSMIDNHLISAPNANVIYTGIGTDTINGHFSWRIPYDDSGFHIITFTAIDTTCTAANVEPEQTIVLPVFVHPSVHAYQDTSIFNGDTANLNVTGGIDYEWRPVPGGNDSSSLSCTHCDHPAAFPYSTTSYAVVSAEVSGCPNKDTVKVTVLPQDAPRIIAGAIFNKNSSATTDSFMVWLIANTTSPSDSTFAIDSTIVSSNGDSTYYQFLNEPAAVYMSMAAMINTTVTAAPTYGDSTTYWDSARQFIYTGRGRSFGHNIFMKHAVAGIRSTGSISGSVMLQMSNSAIPIPGVSVYLLNNAGQLCAFTVTAADGTYTFDDLSADSYTVYPEVQGYKTLPYTPVDLTTGKMQQTNINFIEYASSKLVSPAPVSVSTINQPMFSIYPNPAKDELFIISKGINTQSDIVIYDLLGQVVYQAKSVVGQNVTRLHLYLPPGSYVVHIKDDGGEAIERLVIN